MTISSYPKTLTVLVILCLCQAASAQKIDKLVALNVKAKGGYKKLKAIKTLRSVINLEAGKTRVVTNIEQKRPDKFRTEVYNGDKLLSTAIMAGNSGFLGDRPMTKEELAKYATDADMDNPPFVNYRKKGFGVRYLGLRDRGERKLHHLEVTIPGVGIQHWFLDPETHLEVEYQPESGSLAGITIRFSDFRPVAGYLISYRADLIAPNGATVGHMVVDRVEANIPIADERFTLPAER
jgi:hypothetical protein